jgi:hypothetical protein
MTGHLLDSRAPLNPKAMTSELPKGNSDRFGMFDGSLFPMGKARSRQHTLT